MKKLNLNEIIKYSKTIVNSQNFYQYEIDNEEDRKILESNLINFLLISNEKKGFYKKAEGEIVGRYYYDLAFLCSQKKNKTPNFFWNYLQKDFDLSFEDENEITLYFKLSNTIYDYYHKKINEKVLEK